MRKAAILSAAMPRKLFSFSTIKFAVLSTSNCAMVNALAVAVPKDATCTVVNAVIWSVVKEATCATLNAFSWAALKVTKSSV